VKGREGKEYLMFSIAHHYSEKNFPQADSTKMGAGVKLNEEVGFRRGKIPSLRTFMREEHQTPSTSVEGGGRGKLRGGGKGWLSGGKGHLLCELLPDYFLGGVIQGVFWK